ncbi:uncharacterized protein KY384_002891 [Bacidia gigantensis]|uniref:uncharacterized protein n=1 Tax=Bacidia gigantensis TaxID=2732470 RepID=UPI001D04BE32|nr:uncharacterized protein KY384_002891 [Bacidia gigantensis]KAG8532406.1 hypothetical protein KY384_002891 [Bacidia gigantensis]
MSNNKKKMSKNKTKRQTQIDREAADRAKYRELRRESRRAKRTEMAPFAFNYDADTSKKLRKEPNALSRTVYTTPPSLTTGLTANSSTSLAIPSGAFSQVDTHGSTLPSPYTDTATVVQSIEVADAANEDEQLARLATFVDIANHTVVRRRTSAMTESLDSRVGRNARHHGNTERQGEQGFGMAPIQEEGEDDEDDEDMIKDEESSGGDEAMGSLDPGSDDGGDVGGEEGGNVAED